MEIPVSSESSGVAMFVGRARSHSRESALGARPHPSMRMRQSSCRMFVDEYEDVVWEREAMSGSFAWGSFFGVEAGNL